MVQFLDGKIDMLNLLEMIDDGKNYRQILKRIGDDYGDLSWSIRKLIKGRYIEENYGFVGKVGKGRKQAVINYKLTKNGRRMLRTMKSVKYQLEDGSGKCRLELTEEEAKKLFVLEE